MMIVMEEHPNDRLPQENTNPFKKIDWWIFGLGVLIFIFTFPILARVYRFLIPIAALAFIGYFAFKYSQLGRITGTDGNTVYPNFTPFLREMIAVFKTYFRRLAILSIAVVVLLVGGSLWYTNYSKKVDTENQLSKMALAIEKTKNEKSNYPSTLIELIGSNPLRREWVKDEWGNSIQYTIDEAGFILSSPGKDGVLGNEDDVVFGNSKK
jgi:hypothetical protein